MFLGYFGLSRITLRVTLGFCGELLDHRELLRNTARVIFGLLRELLELFRVVEEYS